MHPIFFVDFVDQEVRGSVKSFGTRLGCSRGRNKLVNHLIVGLVFRKAIAQVLRHSLAANKRIAIVAAASTDQHIAPNRSPMIGKLFGITTVIKQSIDQFFALADVFVAHEFRQLMQIRNASNQVQIGSTSPLSVILHRGRCQSAILPLLLNRLVDQFYLGNIWLRVSRLSGSPKCSFGCPKRSRKNHPGN